MKSWIAISLFLLSKFAYGACIESSTLNLDAELKVIGFEDTSSICDIGENGNLLSQPIRIKHKGCILHFEVTKRLSSEDGKKFRGDRLAIYSAGALCDLKIGAKVSKKLVSIEKECCLLLERNNKIENKCVVNPEPKFVPALTEDVIRCSNKGVNWKILN